VRPEPVIRSNQLRHGRRLERGFTLIELAVVVIIIAVFAALAIPQVTRQLRDRRVHETAQRIAHVYRQARLRAAGQGGAVNVQYAAGTNGQGSFTVLDALVGGSTGCNVMPSTSCINTNWGNTTAGGTARVADTFDVGATSALDRVFAEMYRNTTSKEDSGTQVSALDICFTPLGRTYVRTATASWAPLAEVPAVKVYRKGASSGTVGLTRQVLILGNGAARLAL
jgi:type IV fimbrial biogenesis protein FimU